MPTPTTIARLSYEVLDVSLHRPFGIAGGAQAVAANVLVRIELADGTPGFGEAAPFPAFNGETQRQTLDAIEGARPLLEGQDAHRYRVLAARLREAWPRACAARCAMETAILDAITRRAGIPMWAYFGGVDTRLTTDVTLAFGSVDEARQEATRFAALGFDRFKVKVGSPRVEEDLGRVLAIVDAVPKAEILLDGNAGYDAATAIALLEQLRAEGIVPIAFEQPVAARDLEGLREVGRRCGVPVIADESVASVRDVEQLRRAGAADIVNIKLMKSGVVEALSIVEVARALGYELMIGGMVEARLAMGMSACFAGGLGGFRFVDLDTPLFLASDPFTGGYTQEGPVLDLSTIDCGHGACPARGTPDGRVRGRGAD